MPLGHLQKLLLLVDRKVVMVCLCACQQKVELLGFGYLSLSFIGLLFNIGELKVILQFSEVLNQLLLFV